MNIHKTAIISKDAEIDPSASIGPNVIVEGGVVLHPGVKIMANAYICKGTEIGENSTVHMGAVIGNEPQDYAYDGAETQTRIGKNTIIREYATIHRGTKEGTVTTVGDNCMIMALAHLGHNCALGNNVIVVNSALLAGYVEVDDNAFISGGVAIHQFCRIGRYAMIGGFTGVNKDVPPYMLVRGPSAIRGINLVGLKRSGMPRETIREIKEAFKLLFMSDLSQEDAVAQIRDKYHSEEIKTLVEFIERSKRRICKYRYTKEEYFE